MIIIWLLVVVGIVVAVMWSWANMWCCCLFVILQQVTKSLTHLITLIMLFDRTELYRLVICRMEIKKARKKLQKLQNKEKHPRFYKKKNPKKPTHTTPPFLPDGCYLSGAPHQMITRRLSNACQMSRQTSVNSHQTSIRQVLPFSLSELGAIT